MEALTLPIAFVLRKKNGQLFLWTTASKNPFREQIGRRSSLEISRNNITSVVQVSQVTWKMPYQVTTNLGLGGIVRPVSTWFIHPVRAFALSPWPLLSSHLYELRNLSRKTYSLILWLADSKDWRSSGSMPEEKPCFLGPGTEKTQYLKITPWRKRTDLDAHPRQI